ncbi:MAG: putative toxin-antitoxin system toxin component, PIN family [Deltaproteobacteria bacterium]|nr:putative toxin-antitoxin system toxin component, PIN family [Deltaproteobacteria bacterium]MBI3388952.1 putative toxin-antitoxin system toxin component, PIN family [Deltaproteobacteria bacterium]
MSALLWSGLPHRLLRRAEVGALRLVVSPSMLDELRDVLARPKFTARLAGLHTSAGEVLEAYAAVTTIIAEPPCVPVIAADPDDDRVLACALAASATWIISGDPHLLALQQYRGTRIVTPRQFWATTARRRQSLRKHRERR